MLSKMVSILKALGEPTRLKIVKLLSVQEMCVCELEEVLGMSQPRVSQHLKVLKGAGVILERKHRQKSYYRLSPVLDKGCIEGFEDFMAAPLAKLPDFREEAERLKTLDSNERVKECKEGSDSTAAKIV